MNEKPIIFSGQMVRAILEGRKTQTRRAVKPAGNQKWLTHEMLCGSPSAMVLEQWAQFAHPLGGPLTCVRIPLPVGTRLWVRETWIPPGFEPVMYEANAEHKRLAAEVEAKRRVRPGYQKLIYSRIELVVIDVRCQRLQEITEQDAMAEGFYQAVNESPNGVGQDVVGWYARLWDSINAKRGFSWASNPWVWAYTFKVEKRGGA